MISPNNFILIESKEDWQNDDDAKFLYKIIERNIELLSSLQHSNSLGDLEDALDILEWIERMPYIAYGRIYYTTFDEICGYLDIDSESIRNIIHDSQAFASQEELKRRIKRAKRFSRRRKKRLDKRK